ncbi:MAG: GNAT family N-acetyltransferase [Dehalococcoidia bacterium]
MDLTIRPCTADEMERYGEILAYVFAENDTDAIQRELQATRPEWTHCAFDNDRMVGTMGVIPFTMQLNGRPVDVGGVTGVGTLPEHRRKGVLRQIMTTGLEAMRERGQSMAILWASMGAIYQRFGYGLSAAYVRYEFDPRSARLERGPVPGGACTLLSRPDAEPILHDVHQRFVEPRNLPLHRSDYFWDSLLRERENKRRYIVVYRNQAGVATGHAIYTTEESDSGPGPSQVLSVKDFIACDVDAFAGLWQYLCAHDLVKSITMQGCVAEDDPAPDLLAEPRILNRWTGDAIWLRIVDLERALAARPYGAAGTLVFKIAEDSECPWNEGTWKLETDGTNTTIECSPGPAQLVMPINSLASLVTGFRSATYLERIGRIESADRAALKTADALFATEFRPFLPDEF